jgi:hypothetical protein
MYVDVLLGRGTSLRVDKLARVRMLWIHEVVAREVQSRTHWPVHRGQMRRRHVPLVFDPGRVQACDRLQIDGEITGRAMHGSSQHWRCTGVSTEAFDFAKHTPFPWRPRSSLLDVTLAHMDRQPTPPARRPTSR